MQVAPFGDEHAAHRAQIERVRYQRVERVGRDRHYAPLTKHSGSAADRGRIGVFGVDFK